MKERECGWCQDGSVADVQHLLTCLHVSNERQQAWQQMVQVVQAVEVNVPSVRPWLEAVSRRAGAWAAHGLSGGLAMLVECEGAADGAVSDSTSTAAVRLLFGAFGAAEGRAAMSRIGLRVGMRDGDGVEWREQVLSQWQAVLYGYALRVWRRASAADR